MADEQLLTPKPLSPGLRVNSTVFNYHHLLLYYSTYHLRIQYYMTSWNATLYEHCLVKSQGQKYCHQHFELRTAPQFPVESVLSLCFCCYYVCSLLCLFIMFVHVYPSCNIAFFPWHIFINIKNKTFRMSNGTRNRSVLDNTQHKLASLCFFHLPLSLFYPVQSHRTIHLYIHRKHNKAYTIYNSFFPIFLFSFFSFFK